MGARLPCALRAARCSHCAHPRAQVLQSCRMLGMEVAAGPAAARDASCDFAIVGAEDAVAALRCVGILRRADGGRREPRQCM